VANLLAKSMLSIRRTLRYEASQSQDLALTLTPAQVVAVHNKSSQSR
jgi:hypothetical protein